MRTALPEGTGTFLFTDVEGRRGCRTSSGPRVTPLRSFAALRDGGGVADCLDGLARSPSQRTQVRAPVDALDEGRALSLDEAVAYALTA